MSIGIADIVKAPADQVKWLYSIITLLALMCTGQLGSEWVLVGVTNNSQRGNSERVKEKIDLKHGIDIKGLKIMM